MKFIVGFLSLLIMPYSFGQDKDSSATAESEPWSFRSAEKIVKISPFDIVSFVPRLGLDMEIKLKERRSLQVGAAVIPTFMQVLTLEDLNGYNRMGGYQLRAEGRFYTPSFPNFYFAGGIFFRHLIIRDDVPIGLEGVTDEFGQSEFAYFQNVPMVFNRFNSNIDVKWGFQVKTETMLAFDFYCGLSIRNVFVKSNSAIPEGGMVAEQGGSWTLNNNHQMFYPIPIVGLKIGIIK